MKENVAEFLNFRFEKLKLLKRSERGEVWLAASKSSGELVIIKRVTATNLPYDVLKKFSFQLPAKIFYCAADDSETVIVEEFLQGENLLERLEQKNFLTETQAREILLQMCDGLRELHEKKIVHRDIKPSNLILQGERIRLIDFDAARIFKDGQESDTKLLGTKGYAPPEQFGSGQTDSRSDIYALGVTMKNLLGSNCGGRLKEILDKCTELDPKNRFQNVDELKGALIFEELDEPETESAPEKSRTATFFLVLNVLLFIIRRKFHTELSVLTIVIFLLATSSTLNSNENFSEVVVEEIPKSVTEKIPTSEELSVAEENLPAAQVEPFKFPEIILPPSKPPAPIEPPPNPYEPPRQNFSGLLKTKFYLNGELYDQHAHKDDKVKITRDEWQRSQVRLHITNDTGATWQNPTIEFKFGQNWGGERLTQKKTLPALNQGESADFVIPFEPFTISERKNTSAYLQIWLEGDESKMDEHYWGVWFDVTD